MNTENNSWDVLYILHSAKETNPAKRYWHLNIWTNRILNNLLKIIFNTKHIEWIHHVIFPDLQFKFKFPSKCFFLYLKIKIKNICSPWLKVYALILLFKLVVTLYRIYSISKYIIIKLHIFACLLNWRIYFPHQYPSSSSSAISLANSRSWASLSLLSSADSRSLL